MVAAGLILSVLKTIIPRMDEPFLRLHDGTFRSAASASIRLEIVSDQAQALPQAENDSIQQT